MREKPFRLPVLLVVAIVALLTTAAPALADDNQNGDHNGDNGTECNGTFTGVTLGDVVVPANGVCVLSDSTVNGDVEVKANAFFQATNTKISGDVSGEKAQTVFIDTGSSAGDVSGDDTAQVFVFNATVKHVESDHATNEVEVCGSTAKSIDVQDTTGSGTEILIGDPSNGCGANTVSKSVEVDHNFTDVFFAIRGNTISGNATVSNNSGPSDKFVQANNGGKTLKCAGNASRFVGGPNGTWVSKQGQCF